MSQLVVRRMTLADVPAVRAIEQAAFDESWPATTFERELTHNGAARYVVVEDEQGLRGFGGLWLQFDQAHVVTVAVEPPARRRGIGRLLVHALLSVAAEAGVIDATLEVRASNEPARALYRAYGFYEVGSRHRYYADNGEDAVIMTTEPLASAAFAARMRSLRYTLDDAAGDVRWDIEQVEEWAPAKTTGRPPEPA
jgi:ribosomal-protein-alanine N-acetyltransferase